MADKFKQERCPNCGSTDIVKTYPECEFCGSVFVMTDIELHNAAIQPESAKARWVYMGEKNGWRWIDFTGRNKSLNEMRAQQPYG